MPDLATAGAHILEDLWGTLVITVAILALLVSSELVSRVSGAPVEYTRKLAHVGSGAIVLAFPWLITHDATMVFMAFSFAGLLIGGRVTGLLGSIHNVERQTGGVYYYPFAVLFAWLLADGDTLLYCVPLAIMALADTGAALVGQHAGETTFQVMDGERSVEGSLAFFGIAFAITLLGCTLDGRVGWPGLLLVTLVVAALTTAVEAISVRGSDNLLIPYAAWMGLERTLRLGLPELGDWVLGMGIGAGLLTLSASRARLSTAGGVTVFLVGTLAWSLGGLAWLAPMLALYAAYLLARPPRVNTDLDQVFPTTAASVVMLLLYAHLEDPGLYGAYVVTAAANGAIAAHQIARARGWYAALATPLGALLPLAAATPWLEGLGTAGAVLLCAPIAVALHHVLQDSGLVGRRLFIALCAGLVAWWNPL